ncbi:YdcF family protein [Lactococcus lactis]|uniref:YdcF family protein n=1 Tax=Lactococcus lactis TaxID=1358 RepID=UPI0013C80567|nr:YdcF family protein [Lactococcus lactis]MCT1174832.1 YdcF family protein [Lactococcus lactis]MCT1185645.1 YdcF family protein [Lactococcus lactis]MCT1190217.1 YdcF family protein [Lactococcus lactis]NEX52018.1 YdcF family protein [Lactococcus lactis]
MKKFFKIIGAFVGLILLISVICLALILSKSTDRTAENSTDIKTILVLGSRINQNKKPAKITQERLDAALLLAKNNPQAKIIVSGAKGADEPVSEAFSMKNYLITHHISADRIISEDKAGDTAENIAYSKKYFDGKTVIVTSDFHLYRALYLAKQEGVKVEGFATKTKVNNLLYYPNYYGHEILGLIYAFVFGKG